MGAERHAAAESAGLPGNSPRWRWADVDRKLSGKSNEEIASEKPKPSVDPYITGLANIHGKEKGSRAYRCLKAFIELPPEGAPHYYWSPNRGTGREGERIRLPSADENPIAFAREIERLQKASEPVPADGTVARLTRKYRESEDFKTLSEFDSHKLLASP